MCVHVQLIASYNKQFVGEIKGILAAVDQELRPPHSFDNYPCGFSDCVYCHLKTLLQANLQTLRNNVAQSIENSVNVKAKTTVHSIDEEHFTDDDDEP